MAGDATSPPQSSGAYVYPLGKAGAAGIDLSATRGVTFGGIAGKASPRISVDCKDVQDVDPRNLCSLSGRAHVTHLVVVRAGAGRLKVGSIVLALRRWMRSPPRRSTRGLPGCRGGWLS